MRPPLKFEEVRTEQQLKEVQEFADSFQHIIDPRTALPLITVSRGDRKVGYGHVFTQPIFSFGFHTSPDICSPRDFKEAITALKNWRLINSMSPTFPNGVCFAHFPENPIVPAEMLNKLGFKDREMKLWQSTGGE